MDKNYLVTKSNNLITANYDLSLQEQKLILSLASMVQPNDEEFKEYEFKIKDFMKLLEIESKTKYTEIPKITKELMKKVFEIKEGKDIIQLSWLSSARYKTGEGLVILKFDSSLKPYMLQLKEFYTSYKLENILALKSKYSLRLFELLKCNQFKKVWNIKLDDLKDLIGAKGKSYSVYQNIKNRIILQAQKELNDKTDICFDFEEIKTGRKVTSIKFYIYSNNKNLNEKKDLNIKKEEIAITYDNISDLNDDYKVCELYNLFKDYKIGLESIKLILNTANGDIEKIKKIYEYSKTQNITNFVGFMISMVREDKFIEPKKTKRKRNNVNFKEREYDYDKLEKGLLGWEY